MSVTEAKQKFEAGKKAVEDCQRSISELQKKSDILEESLPSLTQQIENAEKAKTAALDNFALNSNKTTEQALKGARQNCDDASKKLAETNELAEATNRALTKQQAELARINNACELVKRQLWQAVGDEIKLTISSEVFASVKQLQVIGSQCGQTRSWLLDSLFPNIPTGDFQKIRDELVKKYGIDE